MDFLIDLYRVANRPSNRLAQERGVLFAQAVDKFLDRSQLNLERFPNLLVRKCGLAVDGVYKRFQRFEYY